MSWSVDFIGSPDNIVAALEKESEKLTGPSKHEFDSVLPSLIRLVKQNHNKETPPVLKLTASGHADIINGEPIYSYCRANLEQVLGTLV
jgi:hypothetical protein